MLRNGEPDLAADVVDVEAAEEGVDVELHCVALHGVAQHVAAGNARCDGTAEDDAAGFVRWLFGGDGDRLRTDGDGVSCFDRQARRLVEGGAVDLVVAADKSWRRRWRLVLCKRSQDSPPAQCGQRGKAR